MMSVFCRNLNRIMDDKGISSAELSRRAGISRASVSQYTSGKNKPSVARIKLIAQALEVAPEDLVKEPEPELNDLGKRKLYNLKPEVAAKLMGVGVDFVYKGLIAGAFPWGYAVKQSSVWTYFINSKKFAECEGIELP